MQATRFKHRRRGRPAGKGGIELTRWEDVASAWNRIAGKNGDRPITSARCKQIHNQALRKLAAAMGEK